MPLDRLTRRMAGKPLRSQLNQIRAWVREGRTDAWIAHQLDISASALDAPGCVWTQEAPFAKVEPTACRGGTTVHPAVPARPEVRAAMLGLTRKTNQSIVIGDDIEITVLSVSGDKVRIGIEAPRDIAVFRREVLDNDERPAQRRTAPPKDQTS